MRKIAVVTIGVLGLFLNAFPWPESEVGATNTSSVLVFKANSVKTFAHPTTGLKYVTFETLATGGFDYTDGRYSSFLIDGANSAMVSSVMSAYNTGSKFKVDYTKDPDFLSRPIMNVKVFTLVE